MFNGYVHMSLLLSKETLDYIVKCIDVSLNLSDLRYSFTGFVRCVILSLTDESV